MKNFWKITLLLFVVLTGAITFWTYTDSFSFFKCDAQPGWEGPGPVIECYRDLGHKRQDVALCNKVKVPHEQSLDSWRNRVSCILGVAEALQDPFICENNKIVSARDMCRLRVNDVKKDPAICELNEKTANKNYCYLELVRLTGNFEFCYQIKIIEDDPIKWTATDEYFNKWTENFDPIKWTALKEECIKESLRN